MRRPTHLPFTVRGKSVSMPPFTVSAWTSAATEAGSSTVMPPFTVLKLRGSRPVGPAHGGADGAVHGLRASLSARGDLHPAVHRVGERVVGQVLRLDPAVDGSPDEVDALRHLDLELHLGLVVRVAAAAVAGPALVGLVRSPRGVDGADGDPPSCSTISILTRSVSRERPRFVAVTTTSEPAAARASMPPLMPLISMALPAATLPCQWKSSAEAGTGSDSEAARAAQAGEG